MILFFAFRTSLAASLSQLTSWLAAPARSSWWACARPCGSPRWSQTSFLSAFRRCSASSLCCQFYNCTCFQAVMNAMDRDAISGWGAVVHIIEKDKVNLDSKDVRLISCPLRLPPEPWKPGWTKAPFFFNERTTTTKVLSSDHLCPTWTSSGPHMSQNKVRKIPESKCPNFRGFEIWKSLQTIKNSDGPSSSVVRCWPWWHGRRSATSWCTCCGYCWAGIYQVIFMLYW